MENETNISFSKEELERYSRHLILPEFNIEGQRKLKTAGVLVVGCGGLGAPMLLYLTAAGVGKIGLLDFDVVDHSNLQRQVLFGSEDIGKSKVEAAKNHLQSLNPNVHFEEHNLKIDSSNALEIIKKYDIVADGTDNFATRYLVNDACVFLDKVNVSASIFRFDGQVSVFNYPTHENNRGPNYRDLFPTPPPPGSVPSCAEGGVLGVLPGIVGSIQANEVIKVITGIGDPLVGRLFIFDALNFETRILNFNKDENNPVSGKNPTITQLIDYEEYCNPSEKHKKESKKVKEKSVVELKQMKDESADFQLIDVREMYEYDIVNLEGELIPMSEIAGNLDKISKEKPVIIHCRSGERSRQIIIFLEAQHGFTNLYNLKGGILAYADEIDPSMPKY